MAEENLRSDSATNDKFLKAWITKPFLSKSKILEAYKFFIANISPWACKCWDPEDNPNPSILKPVGKRKNN